MSTEFPYRYKIIDEGTIPNPIITLDVKSSIGKVEVGFLVDSGAR